MNNRYDRVNARLRGIVTCIPSTAFDNAELDALRGNDHATAAARLTGVQRRHLAPQLMTMPTEVYGLTAAQRLLANLGWHPSSINALVYVTQTPGIQMPSGAHVLHQQLGLPPSCVPLQANYACAGFVYGLWLAGQVGSSDGRPQRVLLVVGDTISQRCAPNDKATAPIFGDAVSATALEVGPVQPAIHCVLGSDGEDYGALSMRPGEPMQMDGTTVFNFTLRRVPKLVDDIRSYGEPAMWLFHQANAFMLQHLIRKAGIAVSICPTNVQLRGNTSCASIPLLMCDIGLEDLRGKRVAMVGFGAGWTWGATNLELHGLHCAEVIEA